MGSLDLSTTLLTLTLGTGEETLSVEGRYSRLTGRGGRLEVECGEDGRAIDEGNGREGLVGERQRLRRGREWVPLVGRGAPGETTGGRGGFCRVANDGVVGFRHMGDGRAGIFAGLSRGVGTDVTGSRGEGVEQLSVSGTGLALAPATEVAAASDEESCQYDGKDRREPRAEACPMYVDKTESVVGLIQCDVVGFMRGGVIDGEGGLVFHGDGGGWSRGG